MTELRDVRFQQALEHAPDAHLGPDARTRQAIVTMAAAAVKPRSASAPGSAWWRRLLPGPGPGRMPWNAAFATVLLAGFVTLLWHDQPVPDAQPDEAPATKASQHERAAAPVQAPQSFPQSEPPPTSPKSAPAVAQAPIVAPLPAARQAPQAAVTPERKPATVREGEAAIAMPAPRAARQMDQDVSEASTEAPAQAAAPAAAPAPFPAPPSRPAAATEQTARADAAPLAPPRAGLAAGGALGRAVPFASADSPALEGWNGLRITQGGETRRLARADASALAAQVRRLAPTAGGESLA
ncbi:MAG TPA: hypothetical protein VLJ57_02015, partial [Burkholderiaceae bacterium]|nr:hypothetical protein [Burkholderiaceae bacterium]